MLVQLKTLGCRLNEAELEAWAHQFQRHGFGIAADGEVADLVVVNTCAVTQEAVRKSRKLLRRSQRKNRNAKLVVSGCFASLDAESAVREQGVDLIVANQDKDRLVEIALNELVLEAMPKTAILHLPLQAGADSVLRRMARRCKTDEFARLVTTARERVPNMNLTTDIIVGFPGETDSEWRHTMEFVEGIGFGHIHLFAYSPRSGTKAASLPGQIPADIKRTRSAEMQALATTMKLETLVAGVGRRYPVLVETRMDDNDGGAWTGYTPNYFPIRIHGHRSDDLINQIVEVEATSVSGEWLVPLLFKFQVTTSEGSGTSVSKCLRRRMLAAALLNGKTSSTPRRQLPHSMRMAAPGRCAGEVPQGITQQSGP